jgi:large subunit ribosomal protein L15
MVSVHKRKKASRIRGARTCGWGFRQKHKGHGNKGGVGMAGTGKKADHKKQKALDMANANGVKKYFGRSGFTSIGTARNKTLKLNLNDIKEKFGKEKKIDLSKYKILGTGEGFKSEITAESASASAIEKMKKAGGKIILLKPVKKEEDNEDENNEESEE